MSDLSPATQSAVAAFRKATETYRAYKDAQTELTAATMAIPDGELAAYADACDRIEREDRDGTG